jgi:hypothetical protein
VFVCTSGGIVSFGMRAGDDMDNLVQRRSWHFERDIKADTGSGHSTPTPRKHIASTRGPYHYGENNVVSQPANKALEVD